MVDVVFPWSQIRRDICYMCHRFFKSDPGKKKNLGIPTVDGRIIQTLIHTATPAPQISMLFSCLVRSFEWTK